MAQSLASPDPKLHARFPFVAAILCAACLSAAAWTWMRYSYAWDVPLSELSEDSHTGRLVNMVAHVERNEGSPGTTDYVSVHFTDFTDSGGSFPCPKGRMLWNVLRPPDSGQVPGPDVSRETGMWAVTDAVLAEHTSIRLEGRCWGFDLSTTGPVFPQDAIGIAIDTTASRFHGASIAGLVVGAMGVFVFTVALRHWLNQRRAFHV